MKNIIKIISILVLVITFSCDQSDSKFGDNPESGWVQFNESDAIYFNEDLIANATSSIEIPVQLTAPINKNDLTVNYNIVDVLGNSSDIISTSGSVVFLANTNETADPLKLTIDLDAIGADIFSELVFDVVLTSTNSSNVSVGISGDEAFPSSYRITFSAPCLPPTVGGMYSVYTEYGTHDFLPDYSTNTMDMEIVDLGAQTYFVQDFSGGLYSEGPYVGAYGTGATSMDVTFSTVCDDVTWSGQSDPWGAVVPNGDNFVDPETGIVTISWLCEGYGENGISVYTPL
jgi:hypothetical protein